MTKQDDEQEQGMLDFFIEKISSRKLVVFGLATYLLFAGKLESEHWVWISGIYISVQATVDAIAKFKHGK